MKCDYCLRNPCKCGAEDYNEKQEERKLRICVSKDKEKVLFVPSGIEIYVEDFLVLEKDTENVIEVPEWYMKP